MRAGSSLRGGLGIALLGAIGLGFSASAAATEGYCIPPAPLTTDGLALTDVTFTIGATSYSPADCYGITDTGSSSIGTALTFVNNLRWEDFVNGVQDTGSGTSVTVDAIQYTLTMGADSGSGLNTFSNWTLSWADTNGASTPNLPVLVDFALDWKGGNNDVFYLFQNILLPASPTSGSGTINIKVVNPPGNSDLGTSHIDVFFSNTQSPPDQPPDQPLPEPGTVLLIASALLGLGLARRRIARA
ncbi:MAG TPA: PEP-CTERM sorting domain-containing protein [Casimicrobiaceae bacterium]